MIKVRKLKAHLRKQGCRLLREGSKHEVWQGPKGERATLPRHREIPATTARVICLQLGITRID
jgi:predicted RNA binding protein YcfA (HicA-like mRNA interferase family)